VRDVQDGPLQKTLVLLHVKSALLEKPPILNTVVMLPMYMLFQGYFLPPVVILVGEVPTLQPVGRVPAYGAMLANTVLDMELLSAPIVMSIITVI
jgi:hypothetical protein